MFITVSCKSISAIIPFNTVLFSRKATGARFHVVRRISGSFDDLDSSTDSIFFYDENDVAREGLRSLIFEGSMPPQLMKDRHLTQVSIRTSGDLDIPMTAILRVFVVSLY